jgi:hypothetical protein
MKIHEPSVVVEEAHCVLLREQERNLALRILFLWDDLERLPFFSCSVTSTVHRPMCALSKRIEKFEVLEGECTGAN